MPLYEFIIPILITGLFASCEKKQGHRIVEDPVGLNKAIAESIEIHKNDADFIFLRQAYKWQCGTMPEPIDTTGDYGFLWPMMDSIWFKQIIRDRLKVPVVYEKIGNAVYQDSLLHIAIGSLKIKNKMQVTIGGFAKSNDSVGVHIDYLSLGKATFINDHYFFRNGKWSRERISEKVVDLPIPDYLKK